MSHTQKAASSRRTEVVSSTDALTRRSALVRLLVLPLGAALPATLACSKELKCEDTSGLTPEDIKIRTDVAAYVDKTPDATKRCDVCIHYVPAGKDACGTCKVVKGPINPAGTSKLFAPKPV